MRRSQSYKLVPTPEELVARFLSEALAAAANVAPGEYSFSEMTEIVGDKRYGDVHDALFAYFDSLEPFRQWEDFNGLAEMPRATVPDSYRATHLLRPLPRLA
jgi:hypothetical protein